jgi:lambda family phage minor tail protein L
MLKYLADPPESIELFEISGFNLLDLDETLRFTNTPNVSYRTSPASQPFGYFPFGVVAEGFDLVGQGALPQPSITITNIDDMVTTWIRQVRRDQNYKIEGATFTRRLTMLPYLEGGPDYLDPVREKPPDIFQIIQIANLNEQEVKLLLSTPIDLEGVVFGGTALRTCSFDYRDPDTCNYQGAPMFTRDNKPTTNAALDICNRGLLACELRHGKGNLRTSGIPGLGGL